jgi:hypothetical protein
MQSSIAAMTATVPTETTGSTHHERWKIFIPRRTP